MLIRNNGVQSWVYGEWSYKLIKNGRIIIHLSVQTIMNIYC